MIRSNRRRLAAAATIAALAPVAMQAQTLASPAAAPAVWRPDALPAKPYTPPVLQRFTLPNGLTVAVAERHSLPIVSASIVVDAGAGYEPASKAGLAALTAALLDQGTTSLKGPEIARRLEQLGSSANTSSSHWVAQQSSVALTSTFPEVFALLASTITEPTFPQAEFERVRAMLVGRYDQAQAQADQVASELFSVALFEPGSPLAHPAFGTRATLAAITRDDVVAFYKATYAPANTTVILVGDITPAEARKTVERTMGKWAAPRSTATQPANAVRKPVAGSPRIVLVDRPGSVQSHIIVGGGAVGRNDADYVPLQLANQVLGGGFTSRVNLNLRERHGFAYSANSALASGRGVGTLAISAAVRTDATDAALAEAVGEYKRIAAEPVPDAELANARNNLLYAFPASVQSVQGLAGRMQQLVVYGLPGDHYAAYRTALARSSSADVARAAAAHLPPDGMTVVVVGDLAKVEAPIRARNLGAVEVWSAAGERLR